MANNYDKFNELLSSPKAEKIASKQDEIKNLANTSDVQKIASMVNKDELKSALERGDTATLQNALASLMKTQEGSRLVKQLNDIIK